MQSSDRYPEIDLLRTLAILGMIVYHTAFDLAMFYDFDIEVFTGPWRFLARTTAILFLLLVGISFAISWNKNLVGPERSGPTRFFVYKKYIKRGLILLAWGIGISLVTFIVDQETYVRFGILHLIGVAMILLPLFVHLRGLILPIGLGLILFSPWLERMHANTEMLLPLGIEPDYFASVDYFPLLPWFGVILIGLVAGQKFYIGDTRWREHSNLKALDSKLFTWPGRHSLMLYLIHQPIILLILTLLLGRPF